MARSTTILVSYATRHGATREIAEAISRTLTGRGLTVEVLDAADVADPSAYDAVVLGSGVYTGHWLEPARDLVGRHAEVLANRPVWLFSCGPIGDPPRPAAAEAVQIDELVEATKARGHRVFAGKLERDGLGFTERAVVFAFRAAEGDFRDWEAIAAWATEIADELGAQPSSRPSASA